MKVKTYKSSTWHIIIVYVDAFVLDADLFFLVKVLNLFLFMQITYKKSTKFHLFKSEEINFMKLLAENGINSVYPIQDLKRNFHA